MVSHYLTQLTATIDAALDSAAGNSKLGTLDITQFPPVNAADGRRVVQLRHASHAAGKDVAALGVGKPCSVSPGVICINRVQCKYGFGYIVVVLPILQCIIPGLINFSNRFSRKWNVESVILVFTVVTDGAATDGDVDMATLEFCDSRSFNITFRNISFITRS